MNGTSEKEIDTKAAGKANQPPRGVYRSKRIHLFGLDSDDIVRSFFSGNATIAIIVLVLIMVFLFKEGAGFFGQYGSELAIYRKSGLEYADAMRVEVDSYFELSRYLTSIESDELATYVKKDGIPFKDAKLKTAQLHRFTDDLRASVTEIKALADDEMSVAVNIRDDMKANPSIDIKSRRAVLVQSKEKFLALGESLRIHVKDVAKNLPKGDKRFDNRLRKFGDMADNFCRSSLASEKIIKTWNPDKPVGFSYRLTSFLFGRSWVTNSYYQDWYGVVPLLYGSVLVSLIALIIAIPFGVAGAIYVNQFSSVREQKFIKPYIEFISAVPSVVIGFFGVIVWGQFVRDMSKLDCLSWIPGFPITERLNAFTAGCLLALMAIPTIFTLAEDAINNVPKAFTEASYAVGATKLQTTSRIVIPTALSGIVSAVLLGFGRVIGETMVVLLCAGNRIEIPPLSDGLDAMFKPVHTMTGIVAQEMGEVIPGSTHYRALFLVGTLLFFISLLINYIAQRIMRKYSISEK
jgi:phosphate transport system permease protein